MIMTQGYMSCLAFGITTLFTATAGQGLHIVVNDNPSTPSFRTENATRSSLTEC